MSIESPRRKHLGHDTHRLIPIATQCQKLGPVSKLKTHRPFPLDGSLILLLRRHNMPVAHLVPVTIAIHRKFLYIAVGTAATAEKGLSLRVHCNGIENDA